MIGFDLSTAFVAAMAAGSVPQYSAVEDEALVRHALVGLAEISSIHLDDVPSCKGVGIDPSDRTIGDFWASLLAMFANRSFEGPTLMVASSSEVDGKQPLEVSLAYQEGKEQWRWGIRFVIDAETRWVDRNSVQCLVVG